MSIIIVEHEGENVTRRCQGGGFGEVNVERQSGVMVGGRKCEAYDEMMRLKRLWWQKGMRQSEGNLNCVAGS